MTPLNNTINEKAFVLKDFFDSLFARQEFISHLAQRSFNGIAGWIELAATVLLMYGSFWLTQKAHALAQKKYDGQSLPKRQKIWRHVLYRLAWPFLMLILSFIGMVLWREFYGARPLWMQLLFYAAPWMLVIRLLMVMLHYTLPEKWFGGSIERLVSGIIWGVFLLWLSGFGAIILEWMHATSLSIGKVQISLFTVANGVFWMLIIVLGAMWVGKFIEARLMNLNSMDLSLRIVFAKIIKALLIVLSVLVALPFVGIDLTVLSVFGGALGVGIGFGLQKVASNYISGFIILLDRSIRVGDRLTYNNFTGYVTKITSRFVVLQGSSGGEALVPNEAFISNTIINESYSASSLWRSLNIQVAYQSDITLAMRIMQEAAAKQDRVDKDPAPNAFLTNFGDNGVDLTLGFWVSDPQNGFLGLDSAILLEIWHRFHEEGIDFPYPQREVRLIQEEAPPSGEALSNAALASRRQQHIKTVEHSFTPSPD